MIAKFKIYSAEAMPMGEVAVIITTTFIDSDGFPNAEFFIIIPDKECTIHAKSFSFDVRSFGSSEIKLDEDFMLRHALHDALINLRFHLIKMYKDAGLSPYNALPQYVEDNINLLVHLWIRGHCFERIKEIAKKTHCEPLVEKIDTVVSTLPFIHTKEI